MAPRIRLKRGTLAALMAADLSQGEICFATDEKIVLVSDGVGKYHVSSPAFDIRENRPSPGLRGSIFVATDTKESWIDDGTLWQPIVEFGIASGSCCEGDDPRLSDSRTPASHTHGGADITDLIDYISGLDLPYAAESHTHAESDITDLGPYADQSHTHAESDITDLGDYAASDHNHDGSYSAIAHTHNYATLVAASFTQATSSPVTLLDPPNNAVVTKIVVVVDSAASGGSPTVSVGTASDPDRDMDEPDSDIKTAATYIVEPYTACGTNGDNIILTITPDSQTFSGRCYLHYAVPV